MLNYTLNDININVYTKFSVSICIILIVIHSHLIATMFYPSTTIVFSHGIKCSSHQRGYVIHNLDELIMSPEVVLDLTKGVLNRVDVWTVGW